MRPFTNKVLLFDRSPTSTDSGSPTHVVAHKYDLHQPRNTAIGYRSCWRRKNRDSSSYPQDIYSFTTLKSGRSGRAACANFSQLCLLLFLSRVFEIRFCLLCNFLQGFEHILHIFCVLIFKTLKFPISVFCLGGSFKHSCHFHNIEPHYFHLKCTQWLIE